MAMSATRRVSRSVEGRRTHWAVEGVQRAGPVDQGLECVLDDLLRQRPGRVVGPGGGPPGGRGDVAAAGRSDNWLVAVVAAHQRGEGLELAPYSPEHP